MFHRRFGNVLERIEKHYRSLVSQQGSKLKQSCFILVAEVTW
ncbi:hypothetical protein JCM19238_3038 [Vibrio ponticus]|nr:hypothetical protein JCM19238_3038 [Vibrio ponticus]